ncbi:hypothetical protein RF11_13967 [Thelohanellus kitauei]|uniref:Uncharacterized protein n=1 Tax=Thelohanellus kitauei TaxID=669202 RepID=A0A0C2M9J5_THEKT|nr:hypothetical protein RF11_13967 [Thelohanellus kitauei]
MSEDMVLNFLRQTRVPTSSFAIHLSDHDNNTFLLTCKSERQIDQLKIICHPEMKKYSIGKPDPLFFNSLFELAYDILMSRVHVQLDGEVDLSLKNHSRCMIPTELLSHL